MSRSRPPDTYVPVDFTSAEARNHLLKQERDAARAEIQRLRDGLCPTCRERESKRDG